MRPARSLTTLPAIAPPYRAVVYEPCHTGGEPYPSRRPPPPVGRRDGRTGSVLGVALARPRNPVRVAIVVGLVLIAINVVIIGARSQVDGPPAVQQRPVAIEALQPGENERIFPQQQIAVDLQNDLQGQLLIDHILIPDDQIQGDAGLGLVIFQPGVGKEFREFSPGTHNATIEFWPRTISDVEQAREQRKLNSYTWSFKVG